VVGEGRSARVRRVDGEEGGIERRERGDD